MLCCFIFKNLLFTIDCLSHVIIFFSVMIHIFPHLCFLQNCNTCFFFHFFCFQPLNVSSVSNLCQFVHSKRKGFITTFSFIFYFHKNEYLFYNNHKYLCNQCSKNIYAPCWSQLRQNSLKIIVIVNYKGQSKTKKWMRLNAIGSNKGIFLICAILANFLKIVFPIPKISSSLPKYSSTTLSNL